MTRSYLDVQPISASNETFANVGSYILKNDEVQVATAYTSLPEEYAIFSEIDKSFFSLNDTEQHRFLSLCLQYLKKLLLEIYKRIGVVRVLPKLSTSLDEDGAIILNWAYTNFRIYFNFENLIDSSYYGIVAQSSEDAIFTNSGKINESNYTSVIETLLKYVIENS